MSEGPRQPGLQIARVLGVPVRLMPSWFVFAAYLVLTGQAALSQRVEEGTAYLVAGAFVLLLLGSVLLHEIGHLAVARAFGLPVRSITVTLLAGFTEITEPPQTPAREYAVAVSGPMVSVLLSGLAVVGAAACPDDSIAQLLLEGAAATNGAIGVLNLLPGLPLDGGRVLRSVVWHVGKDAERATRASARAGMVLALVVIPLLVVGLLPALGIGDRSPLTILVAALVGAFIWSGAVASLRRSEITSRLPSISVQALARDALAVPGATPLAEAVRQAGEADVRALVVVDGNGEVQGLVSEAWVRQVPLDRRPWVPVADGTRRLEPGLVLAPHLAGEGLIAAMRQQPASEYLVDGPVPRVLVSADVAAAMTG
ncbi:MAG TPA: site-2 protease family protein [Mycobacteriales bacterium]|nr:site-2 protease family protein [Mycobacteriales bacterium]